ncbi:FGGY family carbohydrate kinase [Marinigracilibium pacificum]|uniref:Carbohydrate kinase n=1 Tax=Marinigracilibium pacificum TaxID=2729599 RepID=A0A848IT80_9BACT|nr:FGGY family carbohydrate kinase [Marinigracilibium pacificum]NMM47547.1 carbohydrate kinase [Marinigracilibium pacificum]
MYLIGYDIGSSSIKAALFNAETNETVAVVQYPESDMDMMSRQSGWAEQQPEVWWNDFISVSRKLLSVTSVKSSDIQSIGLSYQMHSLVLIDKYNQVLRPSIIWCDSRAVEIGKKAFEILGKTKTLQHLLNSPGNFTASKLKWVKDNEPHIYENTHKVLLPGDYIAMRLTGEINTTIPGLSEGIFWDFKNKRISEELLEYYGIEHNLIPETTSVLGIQGRVTKQAAEITGLAKGIPVTYRAGDQPTNAMSLNVMRPNEIAATCGTSGVVYGVVDKLLYDEKSRVNSFAHVNYEDNFDRIGVLLCLNGAGVQYSWMKNQIARSGRSYSDMERMVSTVPIGSDGLCILPFGNGAERMLENKNVNSHIFNIQFNRHSRAHLYRAALEGVAFSFVHGVNILKEMGLKVDVMRVGNDNMFQSEVFSSTIATMLDCHIEVVDTTGAIGAARAAGVGAGIYKSLEEALQGISPSIVYGPQFNKINCQQAYYLWESCLETALISNPRKDNPEKLKAELESLEKSLSKKSMDITSLHLQLQARDEVLNEVKNDLKKLSDHISDDKKKVFERVIRKINQNFSADTQWKKFEDHFELIHSDFFKGLKNSYPDLSTAEIKLLALLKMKLTTKDIASQLNLSVRGVETKRYRLRKKLDLNKELSLEDFLEQVS